MRCQQVIDTPLHGRLRLLAEAPAEQRVMHVLVVPALGVPGILFQLSQGRVGGGRYLLGDPELLRLREPHLVLRRDRRGVVLRLLLRGQRHGAGVVLGVVKHAAREERNRRPATLPEALREELARHGVQRLVAHGAHVDVVAGARPAADDVVDGRALARAGRAPHQRELLVHILHRLALRVVQRLRPGVVLPIVHRAQRGGHRRARLRIHQRGTQALGGEGAQLKRCFVLHGELARVEAAAEEVAAAPQGPVRRGHEVYLPRLVPHLLLAPVNHAHQRLFPRLQPRAVAGPAGSVQRQGEHDGPLPLPGGLLVPGGVHLYAKFLDAPDERGGLPREGEAELQRLAFLAAGLRGGEARDGEGVGELGGTGPFAKEPGG
mmetsp:Transcript_16597/g.56600  ORF Transcript_16597/g.56600 Transcript_16597/m.56600 type:complete len:377 (-) Transcript_16597:510-1640(-)